MGTLTQAEYRALLRQDFCSFVQRCFHELNPQAQFLWNWHIEVLAAKLEACRQGKIRRLIINVPPRHLKSLCASIALPAWWLGHHPTAQIIGVSYGQDLSDKLARDCRTIMMSKWYQELFRTRLSAQKQAVDEFTTTLHGFRLATSVGGVLTGRGGDVIIIDDPLKPEEALSETQRRFANEWYDHTLVSRLNDKKEDCIILIMQRLHEDDLVGHVLAQESWDVVSFPAIAEQHQEIWIETLFGPRRFMRHAGDVLHPERESRETIDGIRRTIGEYNFAGQYQQAPAPLGGGLVKEVWFQRYEPGDLPEKFDQVLQSWDTANKPTELSDYSVCTTWGIKNRRLYLLHVLRKRMDYPNLKRAVREQWQAYGATVILIEDKASGTQLIQELIEEGVHPVTRYKPDGDKLMRLHAQTATIENGFVYLPREAHWLAEYLHEITTFPNGKHDDQVDSTSQALAWTKQGSSAEAWIEFIRQQVEAERAGITHVQDGGDVMAAYLASFDAASKPVLTCAGCGKTITGSTRISDGVDYWHIGCQEKVMR
jgi:predicted phage terminase large subunit-like protein